MVTDSNIKGDQIYGSMTPLHLFPYYQTREDYTAKTGKECPIFNPMLPVKHWEDPNVFDREGGRPVVSYDVIAIHPTTNGILIDEYGKPYYEKMTMQTVHAAVVNIPPKRAGTPDVVDPRTGRTYAGEVRMPLRPLNYDEEIIVGGFRGLTYQKKQQQLQPHDMIIDQIQRVAKAFDERLISLEVALLEEIRKEK